MDQENTLKRLYEKQLSLSGSDSPLEKIGRAFFKKGSLPASIVTQLVAFSESQLNKKSPWDHLETWRELLSLALMTHLDAAYDPHRNEIKESFQNYPKDYFWKEFQLSSALSNLISALVDLPINLPAIHQLQNGAVPLEFGGHWTWGEIPHLRHQAELGIYWALLGIKYENAEYLAAAEKIAEWQLNSLDYHFYPFVGLFVQEADAALCALLCDQYLLFSLLAILKSSSRMAYAAKRQLGYLEHSVLSTQVRISVIAPLLEEYIHKLGESPVPIPFGLPQSIHDVDTALIGVRAEEKSLVCTGFGGRTGLGSLHFDDLQLISYGPQHLPLGDCRGFGVEGGRYSVKTVVMQADHAHKGSFLIQHQARLSAKPVYSTSSPLFRNGQRCQAWLDLKQEFKHDYLSLDARFFGDTPKELAFTFFVKAKSCTIQETRKVLPRTLDHYQSSPGAILLSGETQQFSIETPHRHGEMQVIPLGGGDNFWGADFLIAYLFDFHSTAAYTWQINLT